MAGSQLISKLLNDVTLLNHYYRDIRELDLLITFDDRVLLRIILTVTFLRASSRWHLTLKNSATPLKNLAPPLKNLALFLMTLAP